MLVDICKDVQQAETEFGWPETVALPGLPSRTPRERCDDLAQAAELIARAERPLIIAGHGVIKSGA